MNDDNAADDREMPGRLAEDIITALFDIACDFEGGSGFSDAELSRLIREQVARLVPLPRPGALPPEALEGGVRERLAWLDHDGLCQHRQSHGGLPCSCSPACRCRACCVLLCEGLRWFHRAHQHPQGSLRTAFVEDALVRAYVAGTRRKGT